MVYDVIIAGAGPAGSVLAYLLIQRGLSVRLIEKARMPRYKTCGGGCLAHSLNRFQDEARVRMEEVYV